ncbi:hypothetical protein HK405_010773 [Cladochytrium tenue]|nr:hypothetical protein HK405_010773 [Cladochytrium tenue]
MPRSLRQSSLEPTRWRRRQPHCVAATAALSLLLIAALPLGCLASAHPLAGLRPQQHHHRQSAFRAAEHGDGGRVGAHRAADSSGTDSVWDPAAGSWPVEDLGRAGGISGAAVDDDELDDEIWSNSFSEEDVSLLDLAVPKNLADSRRGKSGRKGHDRAVLDAEDDWLDSSDSPVGGEAVSSTNTGAGGSVYNLGTLTTIMGIVLVGLGLFLCGGGFFFVPASSYISALLVAVLAHFISTKTGTQLSTAVYFGSAVPIGLLGAIPFLCFPAAGAFAQGSMLGASASLVILVMAQHFTIHAALGRAALGGVAALAGGAAAALLDPLPALRATCAAATGATAGALGADAFARTGLLKAAALLLAAAPDPAPYSPNSRTWGLLAALIALFVISAVVQTLLARHLAAATAVAEAEQAASPASPTKPSDVAAISVNPAAAAWAEWDSKQHAAAATAAIPGAYDGYPGVFSAAATGLRAPPSPAYLHAPASPSIRYAVAPASPAAAAAAPGFAYVAAPAGPPQPSAYGAPPASPMPAMLLPPPFPTSPVPTAAALPAHPGAPAVLYPATMSSSTPLYPHPQAGAYAPAPTYAPVPTYAPAPAVYYVTAPSPQPQPPPPQALNNNGGGGGWVVPAVAGAAVGLGVGGLAGHIMTAGAQGDRAAAATAGRRGGGDRERFYEADDGGGGDDDDGDDDDDDDY